MPGRWFFFQTSRQFGAPFIEHAFEQRHNSRASFLTLLSHKRRNLPGQRLSVHDLALPWDLCLAQRRTPS